MFTPPTGPAVAVGAAWLGAAAATAVFTVAWHPSFALAVPLLLSTVVHELGHAAAARALGVEVDRISIGLLYGRVGLRGRPDDRSLAWLTIAGPAAHAALGLVTLLLGAFGRQWLVIGGLVVAHALGNLAPSTAGAGPNDGAVLMELALARSPRWARGALVVAIAAGMFALAAAGAASGVVSGAVVALAGAVGALGAVAGIDLLRRG